MADKTKELEMRLKALAVSSEDTCVFFEMRPNTLVNMHRCFFCKSYQPTEADENVGYCVFKRAPHRDIAAFRMTAEGDAL